MQAKVRHGQARTLSGEPGVGVQGVDCGTETLAWGWGVRLPGSRDTKTPATPPPPSSEERRTWMQILLCREGRV